MAPAIKVLSAARQALQLYKKRDATRSSPSPTGALQNMSNLPPLVILMGNTGADMDSCVAALTVASMLHDIAASCNGEETCCKKPSCSSPTSVSQSWKLRSRAGSRTPSPPGSAHSTALPANPFSATIPEIAEQVKQNAANDERRTPYVSKTCDWRKDIVPIPVIQVDGAEDLLLRPEFMVVLEQQGLSKEDFLFWHDVKDIVEFAQDGDHWGEARGAPPQDTVAGAARPQRARQTRAAPRHSRCHRPPQDHALDAKEG